MRACFYSDLVIKKIDFEATRRIYLEWALGIRRFYRYETARRSAGVDPRWPLRELHEGANFTREHDARLSTRRGDALFLLHLQHRDEREPSEFSAQRRRAPPRGRRNSSPARVRSQRPGGPGLRGGRLRRRPVPRPRSLAPEPARAAHSRAGDR
ncbi:MAG: hypothetical protein R3B09_10395 [Nannocystaceae bacterium]